MIVGDRSKLAIESGITMAFDSSSSLFALGYFVLHIGGRCYGVARGDATMLGCSFDQVARIIANRGQHDAGVLTFTDAVEFADNYLNAIYGELQRPMYSGVSAENFCRLFHQEKGNIVWAPDGDAAFDDSSHVLLFDSGNRVRLIAFQSGEDSRHVPSTLQDIWVVAGEFYCILRDWYDAFQSEWIHTPKSPSDRFYTEFPVID